MGLLTKLLLFPAIVSGLLSFFSTPFIIRFANKVGIIDDPKKHHHPKVIHTYPVPRGGGLVIFIAITITSVLFLPLDKHLVGILGGVILLAILGFVDDKIDLNPYFRLAVQFLAASMPIIAGIGIAFLTNPMGGIIDLSNPRINFILFSEPKSIWILSDIFALIWITTLMNFVNIGASGLDGQLSGTVAVSGITIALLSLRFTADITQWPVIILASILAGAYLGFLPWHIYPQKIMPGFGGSTIAGYMLGVLSILSTTKVGTLMVVLAVPLIDTGFTLFRRLLQGKSPFWGDRGHLHHKLLDAGFSKRQVAFFYWAATAILGILALNLNSSYKLYTIIGIVILVGGLLLWLTYRPNLKNQGKKIR
jgi:UDP-GlcNAc:undecaprenyl-phosphate GlcNAc-1-phosphate transferase